MSSYSLPRGNCEGWKNGNPVTTTTHPSSTVALEYLPRTLNSQVYDCAIETPLNYAANLSSILSNEVFLKREDTQPVFSFKIRGAYNRIAKLDATIREKGVVTCSAGNHAQGVALSASKLGIKATIVMPLATPAIKVKPQSESLKTNLNNIHS